jgi:hypothetical protein
VAAPLDPVVGAQAWSDRVATGGPIYTRKGVTVTISLGKRMDPDPGEQRTDRQDARVFDEVLLLVGRGVSDIWEMGVTGFPALWLPSLWSTLRRGEANKALIHHYLQGVSLASLGLWGLPYIWDRLSRLRRD